jgi:hypothetical protein
MIRLFKWAAIAALVLYVTTQPDVAAQQASGIINWILDALTNLGNFVSGIKINA